jgi:23S rRNA pseudouridine1911/1915/1917 synthase
MTATAVSPGQCAVRDSGIKQASVTGVRYISIPTSLPLTMSISQDTVTEYRFEVPSEDAGTRLDVFVTRLPLGLSRSQAQRLIEDGRITVGGGLHKGSYRLRPEEEIDISLPPAPPAELLPESLPLDILFEDDQVIAVNKPAGLVVHPAAGHREGTLVHGLLHHCGTLAPLGGPFRPGIVHRLDKNTSGVIVVAKTDRAYRHLTREFKERLVYKEYRALVYGRMGEPAGAIDAPIDRQSRNRTKMGVMKGGREALSSWWVERSFREVSFLRVIIRTGRTHQIRVHLAHIQHPVVGDRTYGGKRRVNAIQDPIVRARLDRIKRQMLHASAVAVKHPTTDDILRLTAPLPEELVALLHFLETYGSG